MPFEMVDEALMATRAVQSRLRDLPSRVVIYLVLAACLFPEVGYPGAWRKLTDALAGLPLAAPTASAPAQARRRVGSKLLRWLFDLLRGPAPTAHGPGARWRELLVVARDGTILTVPDAPAVLSEFTKQAGNHGGTGYPQIRLLALVACGTRTLIDAVFGPTTTGEITHAPRLLSSLRPGMILLADRNFAAQRLVTDIAATGAEALVRLKNGHRMPVLARYRDGSYLSTLGDLRVRVVDCEITVTTTTGKHTGLYRLATTLLDHQRHPAAELATPYHQRWEIETACLELKSAILGGRVLRARTPEGIDQEIHALLVRPGQACAGAAPETLRAPHHEMPQEGRPSHGRGTAGIAGGGLLEPVADAVVVGAGACVQVYGGMGFTWEVLARLYPRRAWGQARRSAAPTTMPRCSPSPSAPCAQLISPEET
ncbi:IS4 family transposase [Streptomyces sp. NPDC046915]|uniref:IS4 family transposase n=1 Tax=Streptomyces sp. NPDC046915 TaxID=3155257 RepID=UPI0033EF67D5